MGLQQTLIPGIIGGLGPSAHVYFEQLLLKLSSSQGARRDQEYPRWILISATDIPNRSESLFNNDYKCCSILSKTCLSLQALEADFIVVLCNTAHAFHPNIQQRLTIPWISIIDTFAEYAKNNVHTSKKLGLLATDGTLRSGFYQHALSKLGFTVVVPEIGSLLQQSIMEAIYHPDFGIKSTIGQITIEAKSRLKNAITQLKNSGAEIIIAGCTEISVALSEEEQDSMLLDPLSILAEFTWDAAFGLRMLRCPNVSDINQPVQYLQAIS